MDGVLVIDKPAGMTSHDVVDRIRKTFKTRKVGHAGTLDPDATGVLILGIGRATRFLAYSQTAPKRYEAVARFGITTSTQDASGEVISEAEATFTEDDLRDALDGFRGEIEQIPPMVSAVKVGGERLYKKARRGEEVERAARKVTISDLDLRAFVPGANPEATLDVTCSGGTYVRTLVHDLGDALGCGAHLVILRRTEAGGFTVEDAIPLDDVVPESLRPLADSVRQLQHRTPSAEDAEHIRHGRAVAPEDLDAEEGAFVAFVKDGDLLAVYRREGDRLRPDRVVSS
ncbi:MAG: tRNA pseudouridine(55) synthase TruB [Actinobacteria bacterium]|nr:tRNA pseudouridine(55) synthase TruB [Actinomycetota bacterium]